MSNQPIVSVCIANYNGMGIIDDCLRSVLDQDCNFPIEIIVHDDASTDDSVQHIRMTYPQIILIESLENAGFCVANNRMVERATGEFVLLLNNDAALFTDALALFYKAAQDIAKPIILSLPQYDFDTGELLDIGSLVDPFLNPVPNKDPQRGEVAMVMGACLWIPKSLWQELGGFPEWFGSIGEDLYLCCRARLAGYSVRVLGVSGYRHRVGRSFGGGKVAQKQLASTFRRRALSEQNKFFTLLAIYPTPLLQLLLPIHILLFALEGLILAALKHDKKIWHDIYFAGFVSIWRKRKHILQLRRSIQNQRRLGVVAFMSMFQLYPYKLILLLKYGLPSIK